MHFRLVVSEEMEPMCHFWILFSTAPKTFRCLTEYNPHMDNPNHAGLARVFQCQKLAERIYSFIQLNHPSDPRSALQDRRALSSCCSEMELLWWSANHFYKGEEQEAREFGDMLRAASPMAPISDLSGVVDLVTIEHQLIGCRSFKDWVCAN